MELTQAKIFVSTRNFIGFYQIAMARQAIGANGPVKHFISVDKEPSQETISMVKILTKKPFDAERLQWHQTGPDEVFTVCWTSETEAVPNTN